ncbi:M56 family metallopeptidase [Winogradskyella sp. PG-2]|uniref:M56 family metallopeptidase n=1 Tax=Winogradskyella sp. PG-2 TaxID=754409 RepID=UPI00045862BC|nr:M56 family metallopeptidase [Winogradskyella sp. PG-2]BAO75939.1 regulatory sensor-transducer, BlaR1/MecR1 family / TonB-dependent receptor [Winogradskyella sp. PG-2]
MLYTIIQIIAFQTLFLLVYDLFLRRETFFNYNRTYLLLTSVLSLVLPFVKFPKLKKITTNDVVIQLPEVFIGTKVPTANEIFIAEQAGIIIEQPQTPIWQSIALFGIALAALIFLFKIGKLYVLKFRNPKRWQGNVLIVKLIKSSAAFSFFNTIFLGERIPERERPIIYKHELVHIKELHTLDLLFFEVLRIILWFNPLLNIYQNRIKELHEYIADAKALKQNGKVEYYQSLLNQVFDVKNVSFTNTFFKKSLIKKRIAMLQKSKSKQRQLIKYTLLLPLVFGMLIYTSTEVRAQVKSVVEQEINSDFSNVESYTPTSIQVKPKVKQNVNQELTDAELIKKYYNELVAMKKNGASFLEIAKYADIGTENSEKYLLSKGEFLKSKAFMQYVVEHMSARKSEKGTLTTEDFQTFEKLTFDKHKTYLDYRAWKKTDEAKEHWESYSRDGVLRLFVKEIGNQSAEEKELFDRLLKQLENDDYEKIIMTDGKSTFVVNDYKSPEQNEVIESIEVPFSVVEEVPTLVECKDLMSNVDRKDCMNQFVNKHVNKNFNTSLADSLSSGRKRIFIQFKIDTLGYVKAIKARGPSKVLEEEAKRVIKTLPQFTPGKQKGKLVVVPYSLPIVFQVAGTNSTETKVSLEELVAQRDRVLKNSSEDNPVVIRLNRQIEAVKKNKSVNDKVDELTKYLKEELNKTQKDSIQLQNIPFSVVKVAPVHPDCKTLTDEEQRKCTTSKVNMHVNKNFNTNLANELDIRGRQEIFIAFTINKEGYVTDVKARAPHKELEAEAIRVIKKLPQFIPGKHDGENVDVPFSIPVTFQVNNTKKN